MTLVITTASRYGITVVGDRAVTKIQDGLKTIVDTPAKKIFYSPEANISLAFWGQTALPSGSMSSFASDFLAAELNRPRSVGEVARTLADQLGAAVRPLHRASTGWVGLRRGVHVAGYVNGQPHLWHVHMGTQVHGKPLEAHEDFPEIHGGGAENYAKFLTSGGYARIFNGFNELYNVVGSLTEDLRHRLEIEFDVTIPAGTLRGQLAFERGLARFCSDLLLSADRLPQVGTEFDQIAFNDSGLAADASLAPGSTPLAPRRQVSDITASLDTPIWGDRIRTSSLDGPAAEK